MKKTAVQLLSFLLLLACSDPVSSPSKISAETKAIDSIIAQDSTIIQEFLPYKKKMINEINKKLSYAPKDILQTDGVLQSSLGNLMADLMFEKANELFLKETGKQVDFAFSNYGGIRAEISKGDVKVIHAFNLMPFDNTLVIAELSKEKVEELFAFFVRENKAHPLSKQVQLTFKKDGEIEIKIHGKPLEDGKTYHIATSNYLQKGGDNMNFFKNPISLYNSNFLVRNAITEFFDSKDTLRTNIDNRVIIK